MPKFLDHHHMGPVSPEMQEAMAGRITAGEPDAHGVQGLSVMLTKDGDAYCVSDAPDADAVVQAHGAMGIDLRREDVVEIQTVP
jgi:hypothetical protein